MKVAEFTHASSDDPPFYLNQTTNSGGDSGSAAHSDGSSSNPYNVTQPTAPTGSLLAQIEANESNNDDFRGVIDDLTIQNKKLRRKLKQYGRLHCSHLEEEKLFEVKMYGLADHCKRELEEILRSFASRSEESLERSIFSIEDLTASAPSLTNNNPPSSSTSYSKHSKAIDSAYASISGQTGVSQKQCQNCPHSGSQAQSHSKQQNVASYLDDTTGTLVPKHSLTMAERARSKLVVRRLEQIFTGRRIGQDHFHRHQNVSQSAAKADRIRRELQSHKFRPIQDGVREAHILPDIADLKFKSLSEANLSAQQSQQTVDRCGQNPPNKGMRALLGRAKSQTDPSSERILTGQQSRQTNDGEESSPRDPLPRCGVTPDQHLDIQCTPIPSDNIEYIRHLGLALPTAMLDINTDSDDGWIFLNLLTSMAQLHTLNVTPGFIRHAIADASSKFELSDDGTKVRWQGGTDETHLSSDSDESEDTEDWKSSGTCASVSKRGSWVGNNSRVGLEDFQEPNGALPVPTLDFPASPYIRTQRGIFRLGQPQDVDNFQYKPLFVHDATSDDCDNSVHTTDSVSLFDPIENDTVSNPGSHGIRESELKLHAQNWENGPITFYRKSNFCTDLSGNSSGAVHNEAAYCRYTQDPVGCLRHADDEASEESESDSDPNKNDVPGPTYLDVCSTVTACSASDLEDLKSPTSDLSATSPIPLEVSGLGGIQPDDNFMVKVQVRHGGGKKRASRPQSPLFSPRSQIGCPLHSKPRASVDTFHEAGGISRCRSSRNTVKSEIISTSVTHMPPSELPPPSYVCFPFSSSESGDDDDEDDDDEDDDDEDDDDIVNYYTQKPRAAVKSSVEDYIDPGSAKFFGSSSDEIEGSSYASTSSGSDDGSSIDFLANARVLDPDVIAAREMDFETNSVQQHPHIHERRPAYQPLRQ